MITDQPQKLKESPFALGYSAELHWESRNRRALTAQALELIQRGASVWVKGVKGSGRQEFISRLAAKATAAGLPVALIGTRPPTDGEAFVDSLMRRLSSEPAPSTHIEKCENLYAALLDGLWRGGAVLAFSAPDPLVGDALKEAEILIGLKILEQPLSCLLCCGEARAPLAEMTTIELAPYTSEELGKILNHRLVMSSNSALLGASEVAEIAGAATGPSDLMERGDVALGRHLYKNTGDQTGATGKASEDAEQKTTRDIFSAEDVAYVSKLLKEI